MDINHILRNHEAIKKDMYYGSQDLKGENRPKYKSIPGEPGLLVWHRGSKPRMYGWRITLAEGRKMSRTGYASKSAAIAAREVAIKTHRNNVPVNKDAEAQAEFAAELRESMSALKINDCLEVPIHNRFSLVVQTNFLRNTAGAQGYKVSIRTRETTFLMKIIGLKK